jgi:hypothetical protein
MLRQGGVIGDFSPRERSGTMVGWFDPREAKLDPGALPGIAELPRDT